MRYRYGMRLRGFSIGCQPMNGLIECIDENVEENGRKYWSRLLYDRRLTDAELEAYELDYLGEEWLCDRCGYEGECEYPQENHCEKYERR